MDSSIQQRSLMPADFQIGLHSKIKFSAIKNQKGKIFATPFQSHMAPKSNSKDGGILKHFVTRNSEGPREKKWGKLNVL